jgi:hypothetical protein
MHASALDAVQVPRWSGARKARDPGGLAQPIMGLASANPGFSLTAASGSMDVHRGMWGARGRGLAVPDHSEWERKEREIPQILSIYMYRFLGKHAALASHRDVVRRRGTKAKMNVSTENIHPLLNTFIRMNHPN